MGTTKATNRWILGARSKTLPAAVVPVLVGTSLGWRAEHTSVEPPNCLSCVTGWHANGLGAIDWINAALAMVVALALQVGVNYANDYSDGKRGTDDVALRIGPPRLVGNGLATASEVFTAMMIAFGVAGVAGVALALRSAWWLIPLGAVCIVAAFLYTGGPKPYGYAGFGEVAVMVFFGLIATMGAYFVQRHEVTVTSVAAGLMLGLFAMALLMVNNIRDLNSDRQAGKLTLAVRLGSTNARRAYAAMMALPYVLLVFYSAMGDRPVAAVGFATLVLVNRPVLATLSGAGGLHLLPVLAQTARVQLVFGLAVALGTIASVELLA